MPELIRDRTSHRPLASLRMSGIPIGHPNWAVLISSPTALRSSRARPRSQSRTGSLPLSVRKNTTSKIGRRDPRPWPPNTMHRVYHIWYMGQRQNRIPLPRHLSLSMRPPMGSRWHGVGLGAEGFGFEPKRGDVRRFVDGSETVLILPDFVRNLGIARAKSRNARFFGHSRPSLLSSS